MNREAPPKQGLSSDRLQTWAAWFTVCVCDYTRSILAQLSYFCKPLHCGGLSCVLHQPDALKVMPAILWQNIKKAKSMLLYKRTTPLTVRQPILTMGLLADKGHPSNRVYHG